MKVSIFQPTYLPWLGFFKAIDWSDCFVFLDDVQFEKHSWQSRNRINSANGEIMLTVPIVRNFPQDLKDVKINYNQEWKKKHLRSIEQNYSKTPFLREYFPRLEKIYSLKFQNILDLNVSIINDICDYLEIKTNFIYSSQLDCADLHKNDKILFILEKLEADQYLHAEGSKEYMSDALEEYKKKGIDLTSLKFEHPTYLQHHGNFISHLSIIDAIFNCGKLDVIAILKNINL